MKYTVYILCSKKTKKSYVGYTDNIKRRIKEHNSGSSSFTKKFSPWKIIHTEEYDTSAEAITRERYLKSSSGRRLVLRKLFTNL